MTEPSVINCFVNLPNCGQGVLDSYRNEITQYKKVLRNGKIESIYVSAKRVEDFSTDFTGLLLNEVKDLADISFSTEISIEVSPEHIKPSDFEHLMTQGFNRISFTHVPDMDIASLKKRVTKALQIFPSINIDIVFKNFAKNTNACINRLNEYIALNASHISIYGIESHSGFEQIANIMKENGYTAYDPFHFCQKKKESLYLKNILQYRDYIGLGPNAHGCLIINGQKHHHSSSTDFKEWVEDTDKKLIFSPLSNMDVLEEYLLQNLTLIDGIDSTRFYNFFDEKFASMFNVIAALEYSFEDKPVLEKTNNGYKSTCHTHDGVARATYALLDTLLVKV